MAQREARVPNVDLAPDIRDNLGTRRIPPLRPSLFPDAGVSVQTLTSSRRPEGLVDVLLVNPPTEDGGIWIRSQHRVGRRSRENMIWPQVELAQMAALLAPDYKVEIIDANAERMGWPEFKKLLEEKRPKYYLTQVTAPTLQNDMYGVFLAKSLGARTMAFGTHVTPMTLETMRPFPALDFVLRGEPEITLRELLDRLEDKTPSDPRVRKMLAETSHLQTRRMGKEVISDRFPVPAEESPFASILGLAWRRGDEIVINPDRPFIPDLNDLPIPLHELLPLDKQRMPMIKGPFTFIVTSRGCPAGCKYCIKHVTYQNTVRVRSAENIVEELEYLKRLGIHNIHMYADLFTVNRDHVVELCNLIIERGLKIRWTCNSRVDYVDEEMLRLMGQAGCWMISWGIESANEMILKRARKGYKKEQAFLALRWAKAAGIKNWGYFIIGLPGETEESIRETIDYAKELPLDIALFHIAAPYPGTPFFYEVVENNWFRPGTKWEEVDMDQSTVLDYENLTAEQLEYWQRRATWEWSMRPGPIFTFLKGLNSWAGFKSAMSVGWQMLQFARG
ncbi:B12-binding domain-containing radical SAM protein [Litorilinea aerophila]|uniref:Radical SAM protein n=1 Tax=Litorilinea aerophila TaxID=1204385 RepID=A0A540VFD0_9CHLR|nr:radical SAM protein [Litorilinea aerophila]MCC9076755.1 B12-binding domain-containing radical SAM protein [Litorilinea aerophila]GIV76487.1 MAG: radical SAM protein [Litorilinea sp.]